MKSLFKRFRQNIGLLAVQVIGEMEDPEQMGYIHLDRFLPVMSRLLTPHSLQLFEPLVWFHNGTANRFSSWKPENKKGSSCKRSFCRLPMRIFWLHSRYTSTQGRFIWSSQALDVDNTGHIDKELLTQIFTEEGEAFSEVDKCILSSQMFFFPGGNAGVLQCRPRPGDQVRSLQGVCTLPISGWQFLNIPLMTADNKVQKEQITYLMRKKQRTTQQIFSK